MAGCAEPVDRVGFCARHLMRFVEDPLWVPLAVVPVPDGEPGVTMTLCGLCATPCWALGTRDEKYISDTFRRHLVVLERAAHYDGACQVVDGGFRIVTTRQRAQLIGMGVPLYRPHAPSCARRPRTMEIVL